MSTFWYWIKISRLTQCLMGSLATYTVALLSNGPYWLTTTKTWAGGAMFFSIWGASVWHYGRCREIYAKKHWDPVNIENPRQVLCAGASGFMISILISWAFLPTLCVLITVLNAVTIMFLYAKFLDQYWPWKNLSIALVCITPLLFGWFSGHRLHPIIPSLISATFFFYFAREILKDCADLMANQGHRFTMVMSIGIPAAARVAGVMLLVSICLIIYSMKYAPPNVWIRGLFGTAILWLIWFALTSIRGCNISSKFAWMDIGVAVILVGMLCIRLCMY